MSNKQQGKLQLILQTLKQIQDLCLHRYIQCTHRLIAYDKFRFQGKCPGNADALPLPSGKLMWISTKCRLRHSHHFKQLLHILFDSLLIGNAMIKHGCRQYFIDMLPRI